MEKTLDINGRPVKFKATGATIRIYRQTFNRDILNDMQTLQVEAGKDTISADALLLFENIAYVMAKQADPSIPDTADDWLDTFEMFDIYQVLPQIISLWGVSTQTLSESKKKALTQTGQ